MLVSCAPAAVVPEPGQPTLSPPSTATESPVGAVARAAPLPLFDVGATQSALGAVDVSGCARAGGPTGPGRVLLVFASDGRVSSARVDRAPYQGTLVGECVAEKFRGVRIPAFEGSAVGVAKKFQVD